MHRLTRRAALVAAAALPMPALAQSTRPVTLIVPFPPGGSTDVTARLLSERMAPLLGMPVSVENRPGAATVIGADFVARSQPDGHTVLVSSGSTLTINPHILRTIPYKREDFAPVSLISTLPLAITVRPDGPANLDALIERARAEPGRLTYGSNGPSSFNNIAWVLVMEQLGIQMQEISYRGDAAQVTDFMAGRLDMLVVGGSTALPMNRDGRGRIVGWTNDVRMPITPDVPTVAERAPGAVAITWFGLLVPARTPPAMVVRLNEAAVGAMRRPDFGPRLEAEGQTLMATTPEAFADFLTRESDRWGPVLRRMNIEM